MKISKNKLQQIIKEELSEALANEGVGDWLKDKFSRKRKPLPGEDTTPLDMSATGGTVTTPDGETVELDNSPFKYKQRGPGIFSGEGGSKMWNRMQKDQDQDAVKAVGDVPMGAKPEGDLSGVTSDIAPDFPVGVAGLDTSEAEELASMGYGGAMQRAATGKKAPISPNLSIRGGEVVGKGAQKRGPRIASTSTADASAAMPAAIDSGTDYKIAKGDTLGRIAKANGVSVADIMKANPEIKDRDKISAGATLTIPNKLSETFKRWKKLIK
tara:strand:- start:327 stop:1136 length:810 start_codon:yes stop_codon:yes gene_type:complete